MATLAVTGPRVALDTPAPQPPVHTLIAAATVVTEQNPQWAGGANVRPYPCTTPSYWPIAVDSAAVKDVSDACSEFTQVDAFAVYMLLERSTLGRVAEDERARARASFAAMEPSAVELAAWYGGLGDAATNPLGQAIGAPPENLGTFSAARALGELEARARVRGVIHANPLVVTAWISLNLVEEVNATTLSTKLGTVVVPGVGYPPEFADGTGGGDSPAAVLTGQVAMRRGQTIVIPDADADGIDRTHNVAQLLVERDYLVLSDLCQHVGVQVDLTA